jgi:hypothetical protein
MAMENPLQMEGFIGKSSVNGGFSGKSCLSTGGYAVKTGGFGSTTSLVFFLRDPSQGGFDKAMGLCGKGEG